MHSELSWKRKSNLFDKEGGMMGGCERLRRLCMELGYSVCDELYRKCLCDEAVFASYMLFEMLCNASAVIYHDDTEYNECIKQAIEALIEKELKQAIH